MSPTERLPLTVFTPFYKTNPQYLDETIVSVLSQSFTDFEYLMMNDGPVEDARRLEKRFRDPRLRIITNTPPLGLCTSRNAALHAAHGEFIAFIDADDICEPDRLQKQIDFLRANRDHVLVGSALRYIDEKSETIGSRQYPESDKEIRKRMVALNCIAQPAVMARRDALIEAGGYKTDFEFAEDYSLWLRAGRLGKFHNLPEPLVGYRIHRDAGKNTRLRVALRDSIRLKFYAIRRLGYAPSPRAIASIVAHLGLYLLPSSVVYALFKRIFVR